MWINTNCRKFLELGVPDHLTCLLRNLYMSQEATVRTLHRTTDWFQIGKGIQGCVLSPSLLNLGFPCGSAGKDSACNAGDLGLIPGLGRSPGKGKSYPLQYSGLENSTDCGPPGSSVRAISQARILEWVAISLSRGSSQPRDQT